MCSGHGFLNSHTIHQCEDPSSFKNIDDDFEKGYGYVSSGFVLKTATLSPSVMIQVTLMILMGMLKIVMLLVDMVIWTDILIYNIMVWNTLWVIMIVLIQIWMRLYRIDMWLV